jgi:hypothetical protein
VNPSDVLSVLLIIGGDIIQKAFAQTASSIITPVCFSFGGIAYSLIALVGVLGDGRLLPAPDYPAKVFNLENGYARENKNWIVGRLLRDNEIFLSRSHPLRGRGIRISVYEALPRKGGSFLTAHGRVGLIALFLLLVQFGIAAIPAALYGNWGVLMIVGAGTLLTQSAAGLPQWRAEKLPNARNSQKDFAITSGNGSRDIMVVLGNGNSLDLEELAASESPRSTRPWECMLGFSKAVMENGEPKRHGNGVPVRKAYERYGIPVGYWTTLVFCALHFFFWLCLLITVSGLRTHGWFLLIVGTLGMFQNAALAGISRAPEKRSLPLKLVNTIITRKVMDGLMDFEYIYGRPGSCSAEHLVREFFPGSLRPDELAWWNGDREKYDDKRQRESVAGKRDAPRSRIGKLHNLASSTSSLSAKKSVRIASPEMVLASPSLSTSNASDWLSIDTAPKPLSRRSRTMSPMSRVQATGVLRPSSWDVNYGRDASRIISEEPMSMGLKKNAHTEESVAVRPTAIVDGVSEHDFSQRVRDPGPPQMTERYKIAPSPDWV